MDNSIKEGWVFNSKRLTLEFRGLFPSGLCHYEIDLEDINSTSQMLDWIFHIHDKNEIHAHELVTAFREIFDPCANCCSFGEELKFSGAELARRFAKQEKKDG